MLRTLTKKTKNDNNKIFVPKDVQKINFPIFIFWDMVDFVLKILSELETSEPDSETLTTNQ